MHALGAGYACTAAALSLPTFGKRLQDQGGASRKRIIDKSLATEQAPGTVADTEESMQNVGNVLPLQFNVFGSEPGPATERIGTDAESSVSMDVTLVKLNANWIDDARGVVKAAHTPLKGN